MTVGAFPMAEIIGGGAPEPLGVTLDGEALNVAVLSRHAHAVHLCLFDESGEQEITRLTLGARTGDVWHARVGGIGVGARYGLRVDGPFAPQDGHRFDPNKLLVDPYATRIDRPFRWDPSLAEYGTDTAPLVPRGIVEATPEPAPARSAPVPWERTVVYELPVKGFTALHPEIPETQRGTFAGLGHPAAIRRLLDLGVTTVELMPAMAWVDERHLPPLGLSNAWGYNPIALMAPDPRLAPGGWAEVRAAVAALQQAGLEVVLDVVLNHTGEGDAWGPTLSLRGLDNATWYRLHPDDPSRYIDDAGCGNVLALDRLPVVRLAMDALRTWATRAGLDGFRFDLATTLGRRDTGFDPAAPLLSAIAQDPVLRSLKLVAEPWDIGPGGYQAGRFPAGWGEWNDRYRDDVRRFWRGDPGLAGPLATRISGSQDLFGGKGRPSRGVNFVTAHDGFTLADLVSHAHKHNDGNGEANRDGTDANFSWNHGVEGPTQDAAIGEARLRDQRALLATLFLSRGTPMLSMGAESGRSQEGNNNAYAQDNALGWLDWSGPEDLTGFVGALAGLRRRYPALTADRFLTGSSDPETGFPDVAWLTAEGQPMSEEDWRDGSRAALALCLAAAGEETVDRVLLVFHRGHEAGSMTLPPCRAGWCWRVMLDSAAAAAAPGACLEGGAQLALAARTVTLLAEESRPVRDRAAAAGPEVLARLADAAGIAPVWWEETGVGHTVTPDTQRALLLAMGIDARSAGAARDSLEALASRLERRGLPESVAADSDAPVAVRMTGDPTRLMLRGDDGMVRPAPVLTSSQARRRLCLDGRFVTERTVTLAPLPAGRYTLVAEGAPETPCRLLVAPAACVPVPPDLSRFGVAAHLYAVRRSGDQGIGDFTTLGDLGVLAGQAGASTLGLNPLHMLFPAVRERASPYHPSDRRFLDPFSLDVTALGDADPAGAVAAWLSGQDRVLRRLADLPAVDYPAVWRFKAEALERAWQGFRERAGARVRADHARYVAEMGGALARFCRYQALVEAGIDPWSSRAEAADLPDERLAFHGWLQWLADRQLAAAAERARDGGLSLGLYRDLAVGAAPDGAEIWAEPASFARGASIGAPPDLFSAEGQVWDLPPPIPLVQRAEGAAGFGRLLAANMRHAGALRIDHVMALTRLFWIPEGGRGADGAYVSAPLDLLLAELRLQSHDHGAVVVGEDLGTVPDGLRERLDGAGVLSYRVLWFERDGYDFRPPEHWPGRAAACVSTHDLPTLQGWWSGADIAERLALGSLSPDAAEEAAQRRVLERRMLLRALAEAGLLPQAEADPSRPLPWEIVLAIHAYVGRSPCQLVLAQLDDIIGETTAVNLPGTDRERPNWRRRQSVALSDALARGLEEVGALLR